MLIVPQDLMPLMSKLDMNAILRPAYLVTTMVTVIKPLKQTDFTNHVSDYVLHR